jgi:hypothetical protein
VLLVLNIEHGIGGAPAADDGIAAGTRKEKLGDGRGRPRGPVRANGAETLER